jgi:hypothetical protein
VIVNHCNSIAQSHIEVVVTSDRFSFSLGCGPCGVCFDKTGVATGLGDA